MTLLRFGARPQLYDQGRKSGGTPLPHPARRLGPV